MPCRSLPYDTSCCSSPRWMGQRPKAGGEKVERRLERERVVAVADAVATYLGNEAYMDDRTKKMEFKKIRV